MLKQQILNIITQTINKILPDNLLLQALEKEKNEVNKILQKSNAIAIISMGKAGYSMGKCFYEYLEDQSNINKIIKGFIVTPYNTKKSNIGNFEIIESSHPYPDEQSLYAGERLISFIHNLPLECTVIVLLSGGASALIEKPIDGISLDDLQNFTKKLLKSGASIQEINTIRKYLSVIKGGGLADLLYPRETYQFLLSDVIGEESEKYVSSGPMYIDTDYNVDDVIKLLEKYHIKINKKIEFHKKNKSSLKKNFTIGNNAIACETLKLTFEGYQITSHINKKNFSGSIEDYENIITSDIINFFKNPTRNTAMIWGGETTVVVKGSGKGGRNQEISLRIGKILQQYDPAHRNNCSFVSFGTDGIDGPTDAAGGIVFTNSTDRINTILKNENIYYKSLEDILKNNDSYFALSLIDGLIKLGPTGTNLNDLSFFVYF